MRIESTWFFWLLFAVYVAVGTWMVVIGGFAGAASATCWTIAWAFLITRRLRSKGER